MTDHTHPEYDENFCRILTIIEKLADNVERITDGMDRIVEGMGHITDAVERLTIKSTETDDKLNGLIDLMDHHMQEHRENDEERE